MKDMRQYTLERIRRLLKLFPKPVDGVIKLLWEEENFDGPITGMCEWKDKRYWFEFFVILREDEDDEYGHEKHGQRYFLHNSQEVIEMAEERQRQRLIHIGDSNVYRDVLGKWTTRGGKDRNDDEAKAFCQSLPDQYADPLSCENLHKHDDGIVGWFFEDQTTGGTGAIDVWTKEQSEQLSKIEESEPK